MKSGSYPGVTPRFAAQDGWDLAPEISRFRPSQSSLTLLSSCISHFLSPFFFRRSTLERCVSKLWSAQHSALVAICGQRTIITWQGKFCYFILLIQKTRNHPNSSSTVFPQYTTIHNNHKRCRSVLDWKKNNTGKNSEEEHLT